MKIVSAKPLGHMKVYDLSVDHEHHSFVHSSGAVLHNCAYVIADEPVSNFIPLTLVSEVPVTAFTAPSVEAMGGLKMDFLVVNSLKDIRDAIKMIQERYCKGPMAVTGHMTLNGKKVPAHRIVPLPWTVGGDLKYEFADIYDLPEDQDVFRDFCEGQTETVFQFNTPGMIDLLPEFNYVKGTDPDGKVRKSLDSIEALAALTALDRPGPLDYFVKYIGDDGQEHEHNMLVEFARRARGVKAVGSMPILDKLLPETYGIITYQEQLQKIFQYVGQTSAEEADEFRVHISKKKVELVLKDREVFMRGAIPMLGQEDAQKLWESMETFANYGFNKSHAVCYVTISYACAFLKHHYPLEWWCAVLRNASKDEVSTKFWRHCGHLIDLPDVNLSGDNFEIRGNRIRAPLSLLMGIGEAAHGQLCAGRPYRDIADFCEKSEAVKRATATPVLDEAGNPVLVQDKKTKEMKPKIRAGRSALNKGIVGTLIVAGALESLFPPETATTEQISMYLEAAAKAAGKKRVEPAPARFMNINAISRYQMRKQALPVYTEDVVPLIPAYDLPAFFINESGRACWRSEHGVVPFVNAEEIERIENTRPWPDYSDGISVAVAGYILAERKFTYQGVKQACEYHLDLGGGQIKAVKWSPRGQKRLPEEYQQDLTGAVVICVLSKWREDKPFSVDEIATVIQPPLGKSNEESA